MPDQTSPRLPPALIDPGPYQESARVWKQVAAILLGLLVFQIYLHYQTGDQLTAVCQAIDGALSGPQFRDLRGGLERLDLMGGAQGAFVAQRCRRQLDRPERDDNQ